jgi:ribosome recycling factor
MNFGDFREHAQKTVQFLGNQFATIFESTINSGMVETSKVLYHDQKIEVRHIAQVFDSKGRISIVPYDRQFVGSMAKQLADAGFNAYAFSRDEVVVNVPPRYQEETEKVCAHVRKLGEEAKVAIRNARKKAKQHIPKDKVREMEKELQEITDNAIDTVNGMVEKKCQYLRR